MAWEIYRRTLEWEEVGRVPLDEISLEQKPTTSNIAPVAAESNLTLSRNSLRNHTVQRKCTNLSHLLTLRSQGTKVGCSTVCGECAQEISWEDLNKDGRPAR